MFKIKGSRALSGSIEVSGSKNAALPIMACTILQEGEYILRRVPILQDTLIMVQLLENLGIIVERDKNSYRIVNNGIKNYEATYDLVSTMRASFIVAGPLLGNLGKAKVSLPGGCALGPRPVNFHLEAFEQMNVDVSIEHGYVNLSTSELKGNNILLPFPSVGATQNVMAAAVKAKGRTKIENAAKEPEVVEMARFLIKMGAKIDGVGSSTLIIEGGQNLKAIDYEIIPDRIEAGTYIILSQLFDGAIEVKNIDVSHLTGFLSTLEKMGSKFEINGNSIKVLTKLKELKPVDITTMPHPGFPTDLQPQTMVLLSSLEGHSVIEETLFSNRFMAVPELIRMGAKIRIVDNHFAYIEGKAKFSSAEVNAPDLRAGVALMLAALIADGESSISKAYYIDRGYENIELKLLKLGADIVRAK